MDIRTQADPIASIATARGKALAAVFTATSFLSAVLLFSVQPLFAKMVLPVLGGAPSVWAVAVCFFQAALLAGYALAHLEVSRVTAATGGWAHIAVLVLALAFLPIGLPARFEAPPPGDPTLWQLGLFAAAVGLPFVALSANAPLLQAWFARTTHPAARDPYFLYAASNLGSFVALLGYPILLEPSFGARTLSRAWSIGFVLLIGCIAAAFRMARAPGTLAEPNATTLEDVSAASSPSVAARARWVLLAAVPSGLLTAFTAHVATDIASAPLIWVIPLALYLLTFVVVFRPRALVPMPILLVLHAVAVVAALLVLSQTWRTAWYLTAPLGGAAFLLSALVAHRTLYEERPAARYLTGFYLWMAAGGALGGIAAALVAPKIFPEIFEYPILLAATFACRPRALSLGANPRRELTWAFVIAAIAGLASYWLPIALDAGLAPTALEQLTDWGAASMVALVMVVALLLAIRHPVRQTIAALGLCAAVVLLPSMAHRGNAVRSYFGVYRVEQTLDGQFNTLIHGSTLHGAQRIRDENGNPVADITPATYYYPASPMARTIATRREILAAVGRKGRYGVVGLGTGSMACHAKEGETWRYFEIDPVMIGIASGGRSFTFLQNCLPNTDIVLGDARLTLAREADASFDVLIVDAFSSDAVPVHLLTRQALQLYLRKLAPGGVALLHISNRYVDLDTALSATVTMPPRIEGLLLTDDDADGSYAQSSSTVGLIAARADTLTPYEGLATMTPFTPNTMRGWTDDYSDILTPVLSKYGRRFSAE